MLAVLLFGTSALAQKERPSADEPDMAPRPTRPVPRPPPPPPSKSTLVVLAEQVGAQVRLFKAAKGKGDVMVAEARTDDSGSCSFTLAPGQYRLVASYPLYREDRREVVMRAGEVERVRASLVATFGFVALAGLELTPDTEVSLDDRRVAESELIRDSDGNLRIETATGAHVVRVVRAGYTTFAREVAVRPAAESTIAVELARVLASVVVRSLPGARVYLDGEQKGVVDGTGRLDVQGLRPDRTYTVRVELDDYAPFAGSIVPAADGHVPLEAPLEPLPTSAPFEDTFLDGLSQWEAPSTWTAARGVLTVRGSTEVGLPAGTRYRDCDVDFNLRLVDSTGAAWIVRARDGGDGYLFYLCGPGARWKNQLRVYVVRGGRFDPEKPAAAPTPIIPGLKPGESYRVRVVLRGNVVEHWLTPSTTGERMSIGVFEDPSSAYRLGGVGFTTIDGGAFEVTGFSVRPPDTVMPKP